MNIKELIKKFDFDRVGKSGGIFDTDKLNWVNSHYIKEYPIKKLAELSIPYVVDTKFLTEEEIRGNFEWYKILIETIREGINKLEDIPDHIGFLFGDLKITEDAAMEEINKEHVADLLKAFIEVVNSHDEISLEVANGLMKEVQKKSGVKGKNLYMPVRAAISGNVHGPEMSNIIYLLGKDKLIQRANKVLESIK